ncbi:MAG TPA: hypothetical protein VK608_08355 [Edaphobacter sp.]|nr:hypothetical protein [Edaphobacter sp.]
MFLMLLISAAADPYKISSEDEGTVSGRSKNKQQQKRNTGVLRFAQNDDVKLATTTATATATATT